jgi:Xaa-Pro aminopeptidase
VHLDPIHKVYLCDTGGQYLEGTTDITRTLVVSSTGGEGGGAAGGGAELGAGGAAVEVGTVQVGPPAEQKRAYTRVLQGHIALARAVFPAGD